MQRLKIFGAVVYNILLVLAIVCFFIMLFFSAPYVEDSVLGRRAEVADASKGLTYIVEMKVLSLYATHEEWLLNRYNNWVIFGFIATILVSVFTGQIRHKRRLVSIFPA